MAKFNVIILKTIQVGMTVTIEADDAESATTIARERAATFQYDDEHTLPTYEVDSVEESEDEN